MSENNEIFVSGPVICFRLEGQIGDIKKVIYLFGDIHIETEYQTTCPSWLGDDFVRYFSKTMKKTNKQTKYDFFFEIGKKMWLNNITKKQRYIEEVHKYFGSTLNIVNKEDDKEDNKKVDKENNKSKKINIGSKEEINLRLHHVDIRELFRNNSVTTDIFYEIENMYYDIEKKFDATPYVLEQMENKIKIFKEYLFHETYLFIDHLLNKDDAKQLDELKIIFGKKYDDLEYLSNKIKSIYKNNNIKTILLEKSYLIKQMQNDRDITLDYCDKILLDIKNLVDFWEDRHNKKAKYDYLSFYGIPTSYRIKMTLPVIKDFEYISNHYGTLYTNIMDLYALRRMLDKNYVTNVIVYTGALHTCNYLLTLVKFFNFKVTHCTSSEYTLDELHKVINKSNDVEYLFDYCMPKNLLQCINMTKFPENFT